MMPVLPLNEVMQWRVRLFERLAAVWPVPRSKTESPLPQPPSAEGTAVTGLRIVLPRSASVAGQAVDAAGKPVAGYRAQLTAMEETPEMAFHQTHRQPFMQSDEEGRFSLTTVPPGQHRFMHWNEQSNRYEQVGDGLLTLAPGQATTQYILQTGLESRPSGEHPSGPLSGVTSFEGSR